MAQNLVMRQLDERQTEQEIWLLVYSPPGVGSGHRGLLPVPAAVAAHLVGRPGGGRPAGHGARTASCWPPGTTPANSPSDT